MSVKIRRLAVSGMAVAFALTFGLAPAAQAAAIPSPRVAILGQKSAQIAVAQRGPVKLELLQPDPADALAYARAGVGRVTLELGWDAYEPAPGVLNTTYLDQRLAEARVYQASGIQVVLDLGLQYPPSWAWSLPGGTRFVNQFGDTWHGGIGDNPINAVWNRAARQAQARAVRELAHYTAGTSFVAVRVGGLLSGELRLPPSKYNGRTGSLWAFDPSALASSPLPSYRPGKGTTAAAARWLDWYLQSLTDYQDWLTTTVYDAFPATAIDVLLPGWGLRPGDAQAAAGARLRPAAVAATGDSLSSAVDWSRQVAALAGTHLPVVLTTTWVDAPSYGLSTHDMAPVEYLARLAAPRQMAVGGENTGGGNATTLSWSLQQARRLGLTQIAWMSAATLRTGPLSLEQLGDAFAGTY